MQGDVPKQHSHLYVIVLLFSNHDIVHSPWIKCWERTYKVHTYYKQLIQVTCTSGIYL